MILSPPRERQDNRAQNSDSTHFEISVSDIHLTKLYVMDRHRCKLCSKSFANGRALGGHMRSHMFNLPLPLPPKQPFGLSLPSNQLRKQSASDSEEEEEEGGEKGQSYGLRENPKTSVRLVDPVFVDAGSVVVQDRESETESSKNPTRRRSKQTRRIPANQREEEERKKVKVNNKDNQLSWTESWADPEPVSSISDTTTEDVAFCLMMLSRDKWKSKVLHRDDDDDEEEEEEEETEIENYESKEYFKSSKGNRTSRGKYKCETCNKVFKSYQALGGHRASHKKMKAYPPATHETEFEPENMGTTSSLTDKKIHECPVCLRVFSSGQALGGHKRSHVITPVKSSKKLGDSFIDLNLPAPTDDDDASQIELSAVSDAEFVNHIK